MSILKLKERLKAWHQALEGLSPQHRRLVWIGGAGLLLLLGYLAVVSPIISMEESWNQDIAQRRLVLIKYQGLVASKEQLVEANTAIKESLIRLESQFLSVANPAVASSELQEIIKSLTTAQMVKTSSIKVLQPREAGSYLELPVQVQLSGTINQLVSLLYHLEHHKKLLFIPDLSISAPRRAEKNDEEQILLINMVVSGVIKKGVTS